MKITGFERTILRVPFLPGILPSIEYGEFGPPDDPFKPELYPRSVSDRYQDLLRIHTDSNAIGIGMGRRAVGSDECLQYPRYIAKLIAWCRFAHMPFPVRPGPPAGI